MGRLLACRPGSCLTWLPTVLPDMRRFRVDLVASATREPYRFLHDRPSHTTGRDQPDGTPDQSCQDGHVLGVNGVLDSEHCLR